MTRRRGRIAYEVRGGQAGSRIVRLQGWAEFEVFERAYSRALGRDRVVLFEDLSEVVEASFAEAAVTLRVHRREQRDDRVLHSLRTIRWFLGQESRWLVDLALADLKRDAREMRQAGHRESTIGAALRWRMIATVAPIFWDGVMRILKRTWPLVALVRWMG